MIWIQKNFLLVWNEFRTIFLPGARRSLMVHSIVCVLCTPRPKFVAIRKFERLVGVLGGRIWRSFAPPACFDAKIHKFPIGISIRVGHFARVNTKSYGDFLPLWKSGHVRISPKLNFQISLVGLNRQVLWRKEVSILNRFPVSMYPQIHLRPRAKQHRTQQVSCRPMVMMTWQDAPSFRTIHKNSRATHRSDRFFSSRVLTFCLTFCHACSPLVEDATYRKSTWSSSFFTFCHSSCASRPSHGSCFPRWNVWWKKRK